MRETLKMPDDVSFWWTVDFAIWQLESQGILRRRNLPGTEMIDGEQDYEITLRRDAIKDRTYTALNL